MGLGRGIVVLFVLIVGLIAPLAIAICWVVLKRMRAPAQSEVEKDFDDRREN